MNNNKVVMLGDSTVGKSSILEYLKYKRFANNLESTIGCEFYAKSININDTNVKLLIWDTAGQEVFRSFTSNFLRNASIILIVFDLTNDKTFENLKIWLEETEVQPTAKIIICGNKLDLNSTKIISQNKIEEFKNLYPNKEIYYYGNVSAKTGKNIEDLFQFVASIIFDDLKKNNIDSNLEHNYYVDLTNSVSKSDNKNCSC